MSNWIGFVLALGLSILFATQSNIDAAFGWGCAAALWLGKTKVVKEA